MPEHPIDTGRLNIARAFLQDGYGLNVGSGNVKFPNKLNIDIIKHPHLSRGKSPIDVQGSVLNLPFKDEIFDEIVCTDVIEHVPRWTEDYAICEMMRVLKKRGILVMSVPYDTKLGKLLDPVWWTKGHRHYKRRNISFILGFVSYFGLRYSFKTIMFTAGKFPWGVVTITYALNWIFHNRNVDFCKNLVLRAYNGAIGSKGATLFVVLRKY